MQNVVIYRKMLANLHENVSSKRCFPIEDGFKSQTLNQ